MSSSEIYVLPFFGKGHLFPCMELCNHLTSRNFHLTLLISSSASVPSSISHNPLIQLTLIPSPSPSHHHLSTDLQEILSKNPTRPICAIVDVMMSWSSDVFKKLEIPTVAFFTSGACSAAMELAAWKAHPLNLKPDETRFLPGLPEDMAVTYSDLKRRRQEGPPPPLHGFPPPPPPHGFPPPPGGPKHPPKLGQQPPWLDDVEETIALMINTCDDLESPFINYIANHVGKPVWGVGPLLPEKYWKSTGSVIHDREVRSNRIPSVTEEEVIRWLDSKAHGSVLYVSFGTEVGPTTEEYENLAEALESCEKQFIWVLQPGSGRPGPPGGVDSEEGYFPHGLDSRVGNRGLIIRGWAPQLLILSHPSTGGFLSHCGWNSTVEAIGRGIPLLAWPIRGDQFYDAKLVVSHLRVGYMVSDDMSQNVTKDNVLEGIQRLMGDQEMKKTAELLSAKFQHMFPTSSAAALDAFKDYSINLISV